MIYIFSGDENYQKKQKIKEIIKNDNGFNVDFFEGEDPNFKVEDLFIALDNVGLFAEKKYVIIRNPFFLIKKDGLPENYEKRFFEYVENPSYYTDLIIYSEDRNFIESSKLFKKIASNGQVIKFNTLDLKSFRLECRRIVNSEKIVIDDRAFDYLVNSCNGRLDKLHNYIEVFKLYGDKIDINNINYFVERRVEDDTFKLINAFTSKNINNTIKLLNDILSTIESPFILIASLASQLRYLYLVAYLHNERYSFNEIKAISKTKNDYRLEMALRTIDNFPKNELLKTLYELSNLDSLLKSNDSLDGKKYFEIFVINLMRRDYAIN